MNPHIFREYDIRGVADLDLTDEVTESIGRAFGSRIRQALRSSREGVATATFTKPRGCDPRRPLGSSSPRFRSLFAAW